MNVAAQCVLCVRTYQESASDECISRILKFATIGQCRTMQLYSSSAPEPAKSPYLRPHPAPAEPVSPHHRSGWEETNSSNTEAKLSFTSKGASYPTSLLIRH